MLRTFLTFMQSSRRHFAGDPLYRSECLINPPKMIGTRECSFRKAQHVWPIYGNVITTALYSVTTRMSSGQNGISMIRANSFQGAQKQIRRVIRRSDLGGEYV
jgi:hypothetical protein